MEKLIKDGKVAVLVSWGYGAGWYSWNNDKRMLFDVEIAEILVNCDNEPSKKQKEDIVSIAKSKYGDNYYGGVDGLCVEWVDEGCLFRVDEYDGAESLEIGYEDYISA